MEALARQSLRWDAGYCAAMGAAGTVGFAYIARVIDAPRPLVAIVGLVAMMWGGFLVILSRIPSWRAATSLVVFANLAGAVALAAVGVLTEGPAAREVMTIGVGFQVFGFAAVQAHALWSPFGR